MCKEQAELGHGFSGAILRWGDERSSLELRRRRRENRGKERKDNEDVWVLYLGQERTESTRSVLPTPARSQGRSQTRLEDRRKDAGGEAVTACSYLDFWSIYRFATEFILKITPKFSKEVENLQKWKLLNFSNSTTLLQGTFSNSASILKFEFGVHLSIWIISKLLQILYVNFKNFEYKSWSL